MKIKLIAIAKDEAAYISEWIHHHLYFGFDSIDVYTNNITDNTKDILRKIGQNHDVADIDADYILGCSNENFQCKAYGIALEKAKLDGYSHVMFLDIDEFWTPRNFKTNIKDFLLDLNDPNILSFPWALKVDTEKFSYPFDKSNRYVINRHVKTIVKTTVNIKRINIHNHISDHSISILPDGSVLAECGENVPLMKEVYKELPNAFISHRLCRSPIEFVSLLGRGRPGSVKGMISLKDNRPSFIVPKENDHVIAINDNYLLDYIKDFTTFVKNCSLEKDIAAARGFVENRYFDVIDRLKQLDSKELKKFTIILKGLDLPEIKDALSAIQSPTKITDLTGFKDPLYIDDNAIEFLRDEAFKIADENPKLALSLMSLALAFRPHGPVIKSTVLELKARLKC